MAKKPPKRPVGLTHARPQNKPLSQTRRTKMVLPAGYGSTPIKDGQYVNQPRPTRPRTYAYGSTPVKDGELLWRPLKAGKTSAPQMTKKLLTPRGPRPPAR